jgi:antitoxin component YwqK of YwqJK toxin-antitoxin module
MKVVSILLSLIWSTFLLAQADTLNQIDQKNLRQGYWIIHGKDKPDKNYPVDGIIEEGPYLNGKKHGWWIKYHKDGKTQRVKGQFVNNRPFGKYIKYYESGDTLEYGRFESGKQVDSVYRFFECGLLASRKYFDDDGKESGITCYYYDNCFCPDSISAILEKQYTKENGIMRDTFFTYFPSGCLKSINVYDTTGRNIAWQKYDDTCSSPPFLKNRECFDNLRDPIDPPYRPHKQNDFKRNGYNKVYNNDKELWMDGMFKNGKLWEGRIYKYNSDGILLKIEVWKEGKYHSDGQL